MSKPRFQQIYLEITNICNLNCPFCSNDDNIKQNMSIDNIQEIINKIRNYTHSIYLHIKGEPLIHPEIIDILNYLEKENINTKITTNGTKLKELGTFLLTKKNIRHINISLQSTISINHKDEYYQNLFSFLKSIKDDSHTYIYLRNWINDNNINHYLKQYDSHFIPIDGYQFNNHIFYSLSEPFIWPSMSNDYVEDSPCLGGINQLGILVNGDVILCCLDSLGKTKIGNIFSQTLDEILNSEEYLKATKLMPYWEICKRCSYRLRFQKKENIKSPTLERRLK